jgi:hypothetical protein
MGQRNAALQAGLSKVRTKLLGLAHAPRDSQKSVQRTSLKKTRQSLPGWSQFSTTTYDFNKSAFSFQLQFSVLSSKF